MAGTWLEKQRALTVPRVLNFVTLPWSNQSLRSSMEHQKYPEYEAKDAETDLCRLTVALEEDHPQHHA